MIICPNCNKQLPDSAKFCNACGFKVTQNTAKPSFCSNCGNKLSQEALFCEKCGKQINSNCSNPVTSSIEKSVENINSSIPHAAVPTFTPQVKKQAKQKKNGKVFSAVFIPVIALIVIAAILFIFVFGGFGGATTSKKQNYVLYIKNNEIVYSELDDIKPYKITNGFAGDMPISEFGNSPLVGGSALFYQIEDHVKFCDDGKVFYAQGFDFNNESFTLFYKNTNKLNQAAVEIDSNVKSFVADKSGESVIYLKGDVLYRYNMQSKEKISADVVYYQTSETGENVIFKTEDETLFIKEGNKEKRRFASDVYNVVNVSKDFKTIYFEANNRSLYRKVDGEPEEKIASNIEEILKIYETGEIYFLRSNPQKFKLTDYIEDDMKQHDSSIQKPTKPIMPTYNPFGNADIYMAALRVYNSQYAVYEKELVKYEAKLARDTLRNSLSELTAENENIYKLCYFDGETEKVVADNFVLKHDEHSVNYSCGNSKPIIVFDTSNAKEIDKVKLSEIDDYNLLQDKILNAINADSSTNIVFKDDVKNIEINLSKGAVFSPSDDSFYYYDNINGNHADLFIVSLSDNSLLETNIYDTDVTANLLQILSNGKPVYIKNLNGKLGDIYFDKSFVDADVFIPAFSYSNISNTFVYFTEYDQDYLSGTLKVYENDKVSTVAYDTSVVEILPNSEILYICNYDKVGDLKIYKKGNSQDIDSGVFYHVPIAGNVDPFLNYFH